MPSPPLAVFVIHHGFSLFGYGVARDLIRMASDLVGTLKLDVVTASTAPGPVQSSCGATIIADSDWSVLAQARYVFICSMRVPNPDFIDNKLIDGLRYCHRHAGWVIGLGTGVQSLCQAGLLDGRPAAAHPGQISSLQQTFPKVMFSLDPFTLDHRTATCVGGDTVTDMVLELLSRTFEPGIAENVRRAIMLKPNRSGSMLASVGLRGSIEGLDPRLVRYIQLLEQTISAPKPLNHICKAVAVSPRTLARLSQSAFGCGPGQLSSRIRLAYAAELLQFSTQSLQAISVASGYRSAPHFSEEFLKRFSIRPGKYRVQMQSVRIQNKNNRGWEASGI